MPVWPFRNRGREAEIFEREAMPHLDAVYRFARSLTQDQSEVDDLVQETYTRALAAFATYKEGTNCRAWLFKILRNAFINRKRAAGREVGIEDAMEQLAAGSLAGWADRSFYRGPESAALLAATRDRILEALDALPRDFKSVVVLADVEGLSYKEIAEVMGTPIGTVMSRLYRGRRMMREELSAGPGKKTQAAPGKEVVELASRRKGKENGDGL